MKIKETCIDGLLIFEPDIEEDFRGFSYEVFNGRILPGFSTKKEYVQLSHKTVARGPHFQPSSDNKKLITVTVGSAILVATDLRKNSKTYKRTFSSIFSNANRSVLLVPAKVAFGSYAISEVTEVSIKVDEDIELEQAGIFWDKSIFDLGELAVVKSPLDQKWPTLGQITTGS